MESLSREDIERYVSRWDRSAKFRQVAHGCRTTRLVRLTRSALDVVDWSVDWWIG